MFGFSQSGRLIPLLAKHDIIFKFDPMSCLLINMFLEVLNFPALSVHFFPNIWSYTSPRLNFNFRYSHSLNVIKKKEKCTTKQRFVGPFCFWVPKWYVPLAIGYPYYPLNPSFFHFLANLNKATPIIVPIISNFFLLSSTYFIILPLIPTLSISSFIIIIISSHSLTNLNQNLPIYSHIYICLSFFSLLINFPSYFDIYNSCFFCFFPFISIIFFHFSWLYNLLSWCKNETKIMAETYFCFRIYPVSLLLWNRLMHIDLTSLNLLILIWTMKMIS